MGDRRRCVAGFIAVTSALAAAAGAVAVPADGGDRPYPAVTLAGGGLRIDVLLPRPQTMAALKECEPYADARFDWSGRVAFIEYKGRVFAGRRAAADAAGRRAIEYGLGTAEDFRRVPALSPAGANPLRQLRPGVGVMVRTFSADGKSDRRTVEPFEWKVSAAGGRVDFRQEISLEQGWGYRYHKAVVLDANEPSFSIHHHLVNTGRNDIRWEHYCHNWLHVDGRDVDANTRVLLGFVPRGQADANAGGVVLPGGAAIADGRLLRFVEAKLQPRALFRFEQPIEPAANRVSAAHLAARAGFTVFGDWAPLRISVYREERFLCPESFVDLDLAPGQEKRWTSRYVFFAHGPLRTAPPSR
jgi:hypothetical protein